MAKAKVKAEEVEVQDAPAASEVVETPEASEAAAPKKAAAIRVKYRDHKGEPTERTFSKEVHGEDFAALADEFKTTNASKIIE